MCTVFLAFKTHPEYDIILIGNRDEFLDRPTLVAHLWEEKPEIFAGKDVKAGGTWMGVSRHGRFATLTNYRDPNDIRPEALSRGGLVTHFLTGTESPDSYLETVNADAELYNGFNLIAGTSEKVVYYSNKEKQIQSLNPGVYGLSNCFLNTPWPKVSDSIPLFRDLIAQKGTFPLEEAFGLLQNPTLYPDERIPETGVPLEWERKLSSLFIQIPPRYGTRQSSVILIHKTGEIMMEERTWYFDNQWDMNSPKIAKIHFQAERGKTPSS